MIKKLSWSKILFIRQILIIVNGITIIPYLPLLFNFAIHVNSSFELSIDQAVQEWLPEDSSQMRYNTIKIAIDEGELVQSGVSVPGVGHQILLIGYGVKSDIYWNTSGIADSVIANDPFTDLTTDDNGDGAIDRGADGWIPYSHSGKGAVYKVGINGIQLGRNYLVIK